MVRFGVPIPLPPDHSVSRYALGGMQLNHYSHPRWARLSWSKFANLGRFHQSGAGFLPPLPPEISQVAFPNSSYPWDFIIASFWYLPNMCKEYLPTMFWVFRDIREIFWIAKANTHVDGNTPNKNDCRFTNYLNAEWNQSICNFQVYGLEIIVEYDPVYNKRGQSRNLKFIFILRSISMMVKCHELSNHKSNKDLIKRRVF